MQEQQHEMYKNQIEKLLPNYEQNPKPATHKKLTHYFRMYEICLQQITASKQKHKWLLEQKNKTQRIKDQQAINNYQTIQNKKYQQQQEQLNKEFIQNQRDSIIKHLHNMEQDVETGIEVSAFIKKELHSQIQKLDQIYETNCKTATTLKKTKKGLLSIIRRAMSSRITKILVIITVLALIVLIVVFVLKDQGLIK